MAEKRMFSRTVIDSDAFLDMSASAQALYFHLAMRADDDGFVNNPKRIQRMVGAAEDDLKILIAKRFVLLFQSGVLVIKHWRMHNYIQNDRYKPTVYQEEKAMLEIKPNKTYTEKAVNTLEAECIQDVSTLDAQIRLDKISIDKNSLDKDTGADKPPKTRTVFTPPTLDEVRAYCRERGGKVNAERWFDHYTSNGWMVGKNRMKDWKAAVRKWENSPYDSKPAGKPPDAYEYKDVENWEDAL